MSHLCGFVLSACKRASLKSTRYLYFVKICPFRTLHFVFQLSTLGFHAERCHGICKAAHILTIQIEILTTAPVGEASALERVRDRCRSK
jgi:hypothetical protein